MKKLCLVLLFGAYFVSSLLCAAADITAEDLPGSFAVMKFIINARLANPNLSNAERDKINTLFNTVSVFEVALGRLARHNGLGVANFVPGDQLLADIADCADANALFARALGDARPEGALEFSSDIAVRSDELAEAARNGSWETANVSVIRLRDAVGQEREVLAAHLEERNNPGNVEEGNNG